MYSAAECIKCKQHNFTRCSRTRDDTRLRSRSVSESRKGLKNKFRDILKKSRPSPAGRSMLTNNKGRGDSPERSNTIMKPGQEPSRGVHRVYRSLNHIKPVFSCYNAKPQY